MHTQHTHTSMHSCKIILTTVNIWFIVLQPTSSYQAPAPITTPLFGVHQPDQNPPGAPSYPGADTQMYNPHDYNQAPAQQQPPQPKVHMHAEHSLNTG